MANPVDGVDSEMMWFLLSMALMACSWTGLYLLRRASKLAIEQQVLRLEAALARKPERLDPAELEALPDVVRRYFRHVLGDGQRRIRVTRLLQHGVLRTSTRSSSWLTFDAEQVIAPPRRGFLWVARIRLLPWVNLQVCDSLIDGRGAGEVRLLSALRIGSDQDRTELDEAALHRYLAEAVWSPTALLPSSGVHWTALGDNSAMACIDAEGARVSLEFRFNARDEICSVHSPGRWMQTGTGYRKVPWQGHFADYVSRNGLRVPLSGEMAWLDQADWQWVWKGRVEEIEHELE